MIFSDFLYIKTCGQSVYKISYLLLLLAMKNLTSRNHEAVSESIHPMIRLECYTIARQKPASQLSVSSKFRQAELFGVTEVLSVTPKTNSLK